MKTSGIYGIHNRESDRWYVGSSSSIAGRWRTHKRALRRGAHCGKALQRSWNKHGEEAFEFVILEAIEDADQLLVREQFWIDKLSAASPSRGFNTAPVAGTRRGVPQSESAREKMRAAQKGVSKSEEHKARIGAGNRGKVRSEETRARISANVRAQMQDPERRKQQAIFGAMAKPRAIDEEMRQKLTAGIRRAAATPEGKARQAAITEAARLATTGRPGPWRGKKLSEEHKAKMSAAHRGRTDYASGWKHTDEWRRDHSAKLKANWAARKAAAASPHVST